MTTADTVVATEEGTGNNKCNVRIHVAVVAVALDPAADHAATAVAQVEAHLVAAPVVVKTTVVVKEMVAHRVIKTSIAITVRVERERFNAVLLVSRNLHQFPLLLLALLLRLHPNLNVAKLEVNGMMVVAVVMTMKIWCHLVANNLRIHIAVSETASRTSTWNSLKLSFTYIFNNPPLPLQYST